MKHCILFIATIICIHASIGNNWQNRYEPRSYHPVTTESTTVYKTSSTTTLEPIINSYHVTKTKESTTSSVDTTSTATTVTQNINSYHVTKETQESTTTDDDDDNDWGDDDWDDHTEPTVEDNEKPGPTSTTSAPPPITQFNIRRYDDDTNEGKEFLNKYRHFLRLNENHAKDSNSGAI